MENKILEEVTEIQIKHNRKKKWLSVVTCLAAIVVFCTVYALILPAITLEKQQCKIPEHTHSEACYTMVSGAKETEPICSLEKLNIHAHNEECFDKDGNLICGYSDFVLHEHDSYCYDDDGNLWCQLPEIKAHTHSESCYAQADKDADKDAKPELICEQEELTAHEHTDECYAVNDDGSLSKQLICGKTQILMHQHKDDCFKVLNEEPATKTLICGMDEHTHTDACMGKKEYSDEDCNCGKTQHLHMEECYDASGKLICTLEEHTHSEECLSAANSEKETETDSQTENQPEQTAEEPNEEQAQPQTQTLSEGGISAQSEIEIGNGYGYNDEDGSIYWGATKSLEQITSIEPNKPYIIFGCNQRKMMTDEVYTNNGYTYLNAVPKDGITDFTPYCRWYFETTNGTDMYYLYWLGSGNEKKYIQFVTGPIDTSWQNTPTFQIFLTQDKSLATPFEVKSLARNGTTYITMRYESGGESFYINSSKEDAYNTTNWVGYRDNPSYTEVSNGSAQKLYKIVQPDKKTANRLETFDSPNTVINLFDYWTNERFSPDHGADNDNLNGGINKGHNMKFFSQGAKYTTDPDLNALGTMNKQEATSVLRQGIVQKKLVDGFPALSGDLNITGGSTESLDYLFDPTVEHEGKLTYRNVSGLLRLDNEGYNYFNSQETMAEYKEDERYIAVYDKPGVLRGGQGTTQLFGQFFPFNKAPEVMEYKSTHEVMNHYFGLTITTRFIQQHNGCSDIESTTPTTFSFSGDDDVWIFIDNVLVADLGGDHDSVGVDIDFHSGKVTIKHSGGETVKTLRQLYEEAGMLDATTWRDDTYTDASTHTLKFFYMERGNWDSNLYLKYNLVQIPETSIKKVDEWGKPLSGATFAVYSADAEYNMLDDNGNIVNIESPKYDKNWNIIDDSGNVIVTALYSGVSNEQGKMVFVDDDGMPYSIRELKNMFDTNFIVREVEQPPGYRYVSREMWLEIYQGQNQLVMRCQNTEQSGVRAASSLQITATDKVYFFDNYKGQKSTFCCDENGNPIGTLFAVILKRIGEIDPTLDKVEAIQDTKIWAPLYGNDENGYTLIKDDGREFRARAIEAAQKMDAHYKQSVFTFTAGAMQLKVEQLPGRVTDYYRLLEDHEKHNAEYTLAYFWSEAKTLDEATVDNTRRINTFAGTTSDGEKYKGFERVFGASIQVSNLVNDCYVQKMDSNGNRIDGASFAYYKVQQDADGTIKYLQDPNDENSAYISIDDPSKAGEKTRTYSVDGETGVITTYDGKTVKPCDKGTTGDYTDLTHTGTIRFKEFEPGDYILKEIQAPPGYIINETDVMVHVDEDIIYANAGTADDGVIVGRGPGNIIASLKQFASEGQINNTFSWIYAQMKISQPSTKFSDLEAMRDSAQYLTQNNTGYISPNESDAVRSYLEYETTDGSAVFNYNVNHDRIQFEGTQNPSATRRLFTDVGWPYYEIHQDYDYGMAVKDPNAEYHDSRNNDITHLFSRTTYIRFTDIQETSLDVSKVDSTATDQPLSGAQFRLYRLNDSGVKEYYTRNENDEVSWISGEEGIKAALVVETGDNGLSNKKFTKLNDGEYHLEEIKAPSGYSLPNESVVLKLKAARLSRISPNPPNGHSITEILDGDTLSIYTDEQYSGAKFRMYRLAADKTKEYYTRNEAGTVSWNRSASAALVLTTGDDGLSDKRITSLTAGEYFIEEIDAPTNYSIPTKAINLKLDQKKNTLVSVDSPGGYDIIGVLDENNLYHYTVKIPNSTGYRLPATGGIGTAPYIFGGLLLCAVGILLMIYRFMRRKEDFFTKLRNFD